MPRTGGDGEKPQLVATKELEGEMGAMTIAWDGLGADKKPRPRGRYLAKVSFVDGKGKVRPAGFGANATIELVDDKGRVVQTTTSNEQGNYRFKSVERGKYTVRAKKRGFKESEAKIEAAPNAAPAQADMTMH